MKVIGPRIKNTLLHNFVGGIAWGLGLTVGISVLAAFLSLVLTKAGGLPLVGGWLAGLVEATLKAMETGRLK